MWKVTRVDTRVCVGWGGGEVFVLFVLFLVFVSNAYTSLDVSGTLRLL